MIAIRPVTSRARPIARRPFARARNGMMTFIMHCIYWPPASATAITVTIRNARYGFSGRTLAEGFAFQGELSAHRGGQPRGEVSKHLPSTAFIIFTQTHDQVGNRAMGERIAALALQNALRVGVICFLLAPSIPMLFMGEEFAASTPFLFFCDFGAELATAVRDGRRKEFSAFERFSDPAKLASIPDPNAEATFACSKLKWNEVGEEGHHEWHRLYSDLLEIRRKAIVPHLAGNAMPATSR